MPDMTDDQIIEKFKDQREVQDLHRQHGVDPKFLDLANAIKAASNLDPYHRNELLKKILWARNAYLRGVPPPTPGAQLQQQPPQQQRQPRPRP